MRGLQVCTPDRVVLSVPQASEAPSGLRPLETGPVAALPSKVFDPSRRERMQDLPDGIDVRPDRKFARFPPYFPAFRGGPRQAKTTRRRANGDRGGKKGVLQARSRDQRLAVCLRVRRRHGNVGVISRFAGTRELSGKCVADRESA